MNHNIEIRNLANIMMSSDLNFNEESWDPEPISNNGLDQEPRLQITINICLKGKPAIINQKSYILLYSSSPLQELETEVFRAMGDNKGEIIDWEIKDIKIVLQSLHSRGRQQLLTLNALSEAEWARVTTLVEREAKPHIDLSIKIDISIELTLTPAEIQIAKTKAQKRSYIIVLSDPPELVTD